MNLTVKIILGIIGVLFWIGMIVVLPSLVCGGSVAVGNPFYHNVNLQSCAPGF